MDAQAQETDWDWANNLAAGYTSTGRCTLQVKSGDLDLPAVNNRYVSVASTDLDRDWDKDVLDNLVTFERVVVRCSLDA